MKSRILEALGELDLHQAAGVNAALAANDRVKFLFTLLQIAAARAEHPDQPVPALKRERQAAGVEDAKLDDFAAAARRRGATLHVPGLGALLGRIAAEIRQMAAPLLAAPDAGSGFAPRLETLLAALPDAAEDAMPAAEVARITRAGGHGADSPHQLVMDLHKALNAMQAALACETLDGASVYGLDDADRPRVAAFMAGLARTAPLKFDHPGLGTTATRASGRLVIQNDIGTTDAHVIVVHVEAAAVQITYTDIHPERLGFFQSLLPGFVWQDAQATRIAGLAEGLPFQLAVGRLEAANEAALCQGLALLGSRLVFLIDWNRARRSLRGVLRKADRLAVLRWAAEQDIGHRGYLELGGARLVNQAVEATAGSAMHYGDRLCEVLGDAAAAEFVRFTFRVASEGLRARQSAALIRDRVRAELATHFSNEGRRLLGLAAEHAGLIFEIATLVRDGVMAANGGEAGFDRLARRARRFEHEADQMVMAVRDAVRRRPDHAPLLTLVEAADDAADQLEEAAFLLEMLAGSAPHGQALHQLSQLADLLVETAQEWIKALGDATWLGRGADQHGDAEDFLIAADRISALEHDADDAERALRYAAVKHATDFRQLHLYAEIGRALEEAADALKRAGLLTRDHVLGAVLGG